MKQLSEMGSAADIDYLFWVGCSGSFDARSKLVSVAFAKIMQQSGIRFAILGTEEKCNGDPARRTGNEYLAQTLMIENIEKLRSIAHNMCGTEIGKSDTTGLNWNGQNDAHLFDLGDFKVGSDD